jgi:hypothetical protein
LTKSGTNPTGQELSHFRSVGFRTKGAIQYQF